MKHFIFLLAGFIFFSVSGWTNNSFNEIDPRPNHWNKNQNQSFIFVENNIEFSVFQDGQFDFFIPNQGPNVSMGFRNNSVSFSFNTGYNYNPYVQYDSFGAIIQIQNTPIFYDNYGRVNQVGNIYLNYNNSGFVNRIGGLQIFYRHHVFWSQRGFINHVNRNYVRRPWHRHYRLPSPQFCLLSLQPYRQYYAPVRHVYYRPYVNNHRDFDLNRRHKNARQRTHYTRDERYVQSPRNRAERNIRSKIQMRQREPSRSRDSRILRVNETRARSRAKANRNSRSINLSDSGRSVRNTSPRMDRSRSSNIGNKSRNRLPKQVERKRIHQGELTENNRSKKRLETDTRSKRRYSGSTRGRHEQVKPRQTRRASFQKKRSSSSRENSNASRSLNQKRNTTTGRSSRRIR